MVGYAKNVLHYHCFRSRLTRCVSERFQHHFKIFEALEGAKNANRISLIIRREFILEVAFYLYLGITLVKYVPELDTLLRTLNRVKLLGFFRFSARSWYCKALSGRIFSLEQLLWAYLSLVPCCFCSK